MLSAQLLCRNNVIRQLYDQTRNISVARDRQVVQDMIARRSMQHRVCYLQFDPNWVINITDDGSQEIVRAMMNMSRLKLAFKSTKFTDPAARMIGARIDYIYNTLRSGLITHVCKHAPEREKGHASWFTLDYVSLVAIAIDVNRTLWNHDKLIEPVQKTTCCPLSPIATTENNG